MAIILTWHKLIHSFTYSCLRMVIHHHHHHPLPSAVQDSDSAVIYRGLSSLRLHVAGSLLPLRQDQSVGAKSKSSRPPRACPPPIRALLPSPSPNLQGISFTGAHAVAVARLFRAGSPAHTFRGGGRR